MHFLKADFKENDSYSDSDSHVSTDEEDEDDDHAETGDLIQAAVSEVVSPNISNTIRQKHGTLSGLGGTTVKTLSATQSPQKESGRERLKSEVRLRGGSMLVCDDAGVHLCLDGE